MFSRLLDPDAGHWSIAPTGDYSTSRRYLPGTMVIETVFTTESGSVRLTDALLLGEGERGHRIGFESPHVLLREVEGLGGQIELQVELAPRMEYGLVTPRFNRTEAGLEIVGAADRLFVTGDRKLEIEGGSAVATLTITEGERVSFRLEHRKPTERPDAPSTGSLHDTIQAWRSWSEEHEAYEGPYREEVQRSSILLQALTYQPTGAVIAAATTSLPEEIGGSSNWDYRYGWLRDSSFTLKALWVGACPDEAERFFDWMAASAGADEQEGHLPIMFGAAGEHDLSEHELSHLDGYAGSKPVRVGNDAWKQKQLDVFGEVLESAWILRERLGELSPMTAGFLRSVANRAASKWREPDAGIWEGREGERHYLTSKLMCWVALDRAVKLADRIGSRDDRGRWEAAREEVRTAILEEGWSEEAGAFGGAFGSHHLDAGVLLMPIVGFLPADDERVTATVEAIERELGRRHLLQRWTNAGDEGAFVICSYWLAEVTALAGDVERAREIFETVTGYANDLGLLSEEIDRSDGALVGNFPQGLSHIGLINAAWAIAQAERSTG